MTIFTESVVEQAPLAWLDSVGWQIAPCLNNTLGIPVSLVDTTLPEFVSGEQGRKNSYTLSR